MGYYTHVRGEISIEPPLKWGEMAGSPFLFAMADGEKDVRIRVEETEVETEDGVLTRKMGVAIVPWSEDSYKARNVDGDLEELIALHGEGRQFPGQLEGEGERNGDMWKMRVSADHRVQQIKAQTVWPDWPTDA